MAFDINAFEQKYKITNFAAPIDDRYSVGKATLTPTKPVKQPFLPNLAHGAANVVASTAGAIGHTVTNGFTGLYNDAAGNIAQNSAQRNVDVRNKQLQFKQNAIIKKYAKDKSPDAKKRYKSEMQALLSEGTKLSADTKKTTDMYSGYGKVAGHALEAGSTAAVALAPLAAPALAGLSAATKLAAVRAGVTGSEVAAGAKVGKGAITTAARMGLDNAFATGKTLGGGGIKGAPLAVAGKVARNALVTQPTIAAPVDAVKDFSKGDIKGGLLNTAIAASPLGFAAGAKYLPKLGKVASEAVYGRQGFFDAVKKAGGPDYVKALEEAKTPAQKQRIEGVLRQLQQFNMDQAKGNTNEAVSRLISHLHGDLGDNLSTLNHNDALKHAGNWMKTEQTIAKAGKEGRIFTSDGTVHQLKEGESYIAARANPIEIKSLREQWKTAKTPEERKQILTSMVKNGATIGDNKHLLEKLTRIADDGDWSKQLAPQNLPALHRLRIGGKVEPTTVENIMDGAKVGRAPKLAQGYGVGVVKMERPAIKAVKDTAALDRGKAANAVLGKLGAGLRKAGVSTEGQNPVVFAKWNAAFNGELKKVEGLGMNAKTVLDELSKDQETVQRLGVLDERQLSVSAIKDALHVTDDQAKGVQKALTAAYDRMSTSEIGLAGKIQNTLYKAPLNAYRNFSRAQNVGRYELNPFFRLQTRVETEALSQVQAQGKAVNAPLSQQINRLFANGRKQENELDAAVTHLKDNGFFRGSGMGGLSVQDNAYGQLGSRLAPYQERSIGGLVLTLAKRDGKTVEQYMKDANPEQMDAIRAVIQYPKAGFASSNFAKAANLFLFPSRYSIKLTTVLGKALANQHPAVQIATLKGISDFNQYLASTEGIKWKSDNSEVLGIINYLSPLNNLKAVFSSLRGEGASISDIGVVGGLPFGFISEILKHTGHPLTKEPPYLNPKTGEIVPEDIPANEAGAIKQVIADIIGTMYSAPLRTFGFNMSKNEATHSIPGMSFSKGEMKKVADSSSLTTAQKKVQRVLSPTKPSAATTKKYSTITRGTPPTIKRVAITPIYKSGSGKLRKGPKPKTYAIRRGQNGF